MKNALLGGEIFPMIISMGKEDFLTEKPESSKLVNSARGVPV